MDAVHYAYDHDVIVVAAAGNECEAVSQPANCPGALAITASDANFRPWSGTNYGGEVAFTASGSNDPEESLNGSKLPPVSGTSGAAAIVSGTFALMRSHFPQMSARDIVTQALYNVHNGLGPGHFGERINDKLGYGKILPYFALHDPVPPNASNPVYDHWAGLMGTPHPDNGGIVVHPRRTPDGGIRVPVTGHGIDVDSHSSHTGAVIAGVVIAFVVVGGLVAVLRPRRSRRRTAGTAGPPGPHWP